MKFVYFLDKKLTFQHFFYFFLRCEPDRRFYFLFFFLRRGQKDPCRSSSTKQYTECGLVNLDFHVLCQPTLCRWSTTQVCSAQHSFVTLKWCKMHVPQTQTNGQTGTTKRIISQIYSKWKCLSIHTPPALYISQSFCTKMHYVASMRQMVTRWHHTIMVLQGGKAWKSLFLTSWP